jgi:hypothetical protein
MEEIIVEKEKPKGTQVPGVSLLDMCKRHCNLCRVPVCENSGHGADNGQRKDSSKLRKQGYIHAIAADRGISFGRTIDITLLQASSPPNGEWETKNKSLPVQQKPWVS